MSPRCIGILLIVSLYLPNLAIADSDEPTGSAFESVTVPPEAVRLSADFEGVIDSTVGTAYFCKGIAEFILAPTERRPDNKAVLLTLDPRKLATTARCDSPDGPTERAELAERDDLRLPQGTEVWYGFRFLVPRAMKGRFIGQRLVIAQLKQHPKACALRIGPVDASIKSEGSPTVSLRLIEDDIGDVMGLQLAVATDDVRKIPVGQLMRHRDTFLDNWHDVVLHLKVVPRGSQSEHISFVEGWLDDQAFNPGHYGMLEGGELPDAAEPFGYSNLFGCTYFKFGIYRDRQEQPWSIAFDRFRRGASREWIEDNGN